MVNCSGLATRVGDSSTDLSLLRVVPAVVRKTLIERYEFIAAEKEMVNDLTDGFRSCATCHAWASSQESVRCE